MTRTLILPDVHNNFGLAETIIEKENADEVVFLGDYFDIRSCQIKDGD